MPLTSIVVRLIVIPNRNWSQSFRKVFSVREMSAKGLFSIFVYEVILAFVVVDAYNGESFVEFFSIIKTWFNDYFPIIVHIPITTSEFLKNP